MLDVREQIKLLNNDEMLVLRELIEKHNEGIHKLRNKDFLNISEEREKKGKPYIKQLTRGESSKALHTLEVAYIIEREAEIFYKLTKRAILSLKGAEKGHDI